MSESRKIHHSDGEQPKDGEHVALDGEKEFRSSKVSLSKSKEKASPDGAHEKLLHMEDDAKIVRVDMVDAKYVAGDHRNGDPKIELDANKSKQFSGLTKEELMKYADDPFWVNLRWCMFVLFWALWLGMLAGAITIIIRAPKCAAPTPKTWFEKGPLVELDSNEYVDSYDYAIAESQLPLLQESKAQAVFIQAHAYDALDKPDAVDKFKVFVQKAMEYSVKVIVDLTPNYVPIDHFWFQQSQNKSGEYTDYFVWAAGKEFDEDKPKVPNNWVSTLNTSAWTYSEVRKEYYLHQFEEGQPDLNFNNERVVKLFGDALAKWMKAGAAGVRLNKARLMVVDPSLGDEVTARGAGAAAGATHHHYAFWWHKHTADQAKLDSLLQGFVSATYDASSSSPEETVFTLKEEGDPSPELYLLGRNITLHPPSTAPIPVTNATAAATQLDKKTKGRWPIVQLTSDERSARELALFSLLLPAAPVFLASQLDNDTSTESLSHLASIRSDASVLQGERSLRAVKGLAADNSTSELLACARWKTGHTGYVGVFNPSEDHLRANLTSLAAVPATLTVHHVSRDVRAVNNYTNNYSVRADDVLVPAKSTVVLSYVPQTTAEE